MGDYKTRYRRMKAWFWLAAGAAVLAAAVLWAYFLLRESPAGTSSIEKPSQPAPEQPSGPER